MNNFFIVLFTVLSINVLCVSDPGNFRISHCNISLNYHGDSLFTLNAELTINLLSPTNKIKLLISEDMLMRGVELRSHGAKVNLNYEIKGDSIFIDLPHKYASNKTVRINYCYAINIDSVKNQVTQLYFWHPYCKNMLSQYRLTVHAKNDIQFFSNGELISKTHKGAVDSYLFDMKQNIPRLSLVMAPKDSLISFSAKVNNTKFMYSLLPGDTSVATKLINETTAAFTWLSELLGGYLYNNLTFIGIPDYQAVNSQPAFILMGQMFVRAFNNDKYDFPPHELAHQWFGSGVMVRQNDPRSWCIYEPMAEYLKMMYDEKTKGREFFVKELKEKVDEFVNDYEGKEEDKPLLESGASRVTYLKGPYIMNQLHQLMGDAAWRQFISSLFMKYKSKTMGYDEFVGALGSVKKDYAEEFSRLVSIKGMKDK